MNERVRQPKSCSTCVNKLLCPIIGRPCAGHDSVKLFKSLLTQYAPGVDWDIMLDEIKEHRKLIRGYRGNE